MTGTFLLEEISEVALELKRKIENELQPAYKRELKHYHQRNPKPRSDSIFPVLYNFSRLIKWEEGVANITIRYENHPLVQTLNKIQDNCSHEYGEWYDIPGPQGKSRDCPICYHTEAVYKEF